MSKLNNEAGDFQFFDSNKIAVQCYFPQNYSLGKPHSTEYGSSNPQSSAETQMLK